MGDRPEPFDAHTGEVLPAIGRAADGGLIPSETKSAGNLVDMLEDGRFSAEVYRDAMALGKQLGDRAKMTESKQKGSITIVISMEHDGDSFRMQAEHKVKAPKVPRPRSVAWQDDRGHFTRFPPGQGQFFGVRDSSAGGDARPMRPTN